MSIKKYLQTLTKEQLIGQIIELHQKYKDVKTYYEYFIDPNNNNVAEKYKLIIRNEFYPKKNSVGNPKLSVAKKAVNDFKKLSPPPEALIDTMLYYVENGVGFTNDYGDMYEAYYTSMESMFEAACKLVNEYGLKAIFEKRCATIVKATEDFGWGFYDALSESFYQVFEN